MSDKFIICNVDKNTRLVGGSDSFILQTRKAKNKEWVNEFYYYSVGDLVRGVIKYISAQNPRLSKTNGIDALMLLLDKLEKRTESFSDRMQQIFDSDPIEQLSDSSEGEE